VEEGDGGEMTWQWACEGVGVNEGAFSLWGLPLPFCSDIAGVSKPSFFCCYYCCVGRSLEDGVPGLEIIGGVVKEDIRQAPAGILLSYII